MDAGKEAMSSSSCFAFCMISIAYCFRSSGSSFSSVNDHNETKRRVLTFELCGRTGFGVDGEQGKVSRDLLEASFLVDAVDSASHS